MARRDPRPDLTVTFYPKRTAARSEPRRLTPSQALRLVQDHPAPPLGDETRRYPATPAPSVPAPVAGGSDRRRPAGSGGRPASRWRRLLWRLFG